MRDPGTARRRSVAALSVLGALVGAFVLVRGVEGSPSTGAPPAVAHDPHDVPADVSSPRASPGTATGPTPAGRRRHGIADQVSGPVLPPSPPVRVTIPRLGVSSTLESLGVDGRSGAMDVPVDPARAGWYHLGPTPGALGPAIIAGHVSWNQVPGVFSGLARMQPGDVVSVDREDGRRAVFVVTRVARFAKTHFPTRSVFGAIDHAGLRLITCGGDYDAAAHHYSDNIVVFARLSARAS